MNSSLITSLDLTSTTLEKITARLLNHLKSGQGLLTVFTPNAEQVVQASRNRQFLQTLHQADLLIPDGMGLVWGYNLLLKTKYSKSTSEPVSRIAGVDLTRELLKQLSTENKSEINQTRMLLIGGRNYPKNELPFNLKWTEGFNQIDQPQPSEQRALRELISSWQPELVFVAFGAPYQEQWVIDNQNWLEEQGVKAAMVVGGSFDTLLGRLKRAPVWMRKLGLEWLFRLFQEPWRWRRQLRLIKFVGLVLKEIAA